MKNFIIAGLLLLITAALSAQNKKDAVFADKNGAIRGYDPVAYFTENKPVKGNKSISYEWQNAVWHFSTTAHRDSFALHPEQFAPQYGGWCAYGWAQGYPAKTEPEAWRIVDGKLYLNYDLSIQKKWDKKQKQYISEADKNWPGY